MYYAICNISSKQVSILPFVPFTDWRLRRGGMIHDLGGQTYQSLVYPYPIAITITQVGGWPYPRTCCLVWVLVCCNPWLLTAGSTRLDSKENRPLRTISMDEPNEDKFDTWPDTTGQNWINSSYTFNPYRTALVDAGWVGGDTRWRCLWSWSVTWRKRFLRPPRRTVMVILMSYVFRSSKDV